MCRLDVNGVSENHCLFNYSLGQIVTCDSDDTASGKQVAECVVGFHEGCNEMRIF